MKQLNSQSRDSFAPCVRKLSNLQRQTLISIYFLKNILKLLKGNGQSLMAHWNWLPLVRFIVKRAMSAFLILSQQQIIEKQNSILPLWCCRSTVMPSIKKRGERILFYRRVLKHKELVQLGKLIKSQSLRIKKMKTRRLLLSFISCLQKKQSGNINSVSKGFLSFCKKWSNPSSERVSTQQPWFHFWRTKTGIKQQSQP